MTSQRTKANSASSLRTAKRFATERTITRSEQAPRNGKPGPQGAQIPISSDADIVVARQKGRELATLLGFTTGDSTLISTAISELARNIVRYAKRGEIILNSINSDERHGIVVVARDEGPGIVNIGQAMQDGFSTSGSLGLGLPGVKRLVDEFEIVSKVGEGTTVSVKKWKR